MEGDGDVLVAAASPDGESSGVVGVELGKRKVRDVELVSGRQCSGLVTGIFWLSVVGASGVAGVQSSLKIWAWAWWSIGLGASA